MDLYTKNGKTLHISVSTVYSKWGKVVGRIKNEKIKNASSQQNL